MYTLKSSLYHLSKYSKFATSFKTKVTSLSYSTVTIKYPGHVPLNGIEKLGLAVRAAFTALADPLRQDMVAALGETTGELALRRMHKKMLSDRVGRSILRDKLVISSSTINLGSLRSYPDLTLGREYVRFLDDNGVSPDTRCKVQYVDDPELAYVMQRYRETHDFFHTLTGLPTTVEAELALKFFELGQTGLPMTALGALVGPLALSSSQRSSLFSNLVPWAFQCGSGAKFLLNVRYEDNFHRPVSDLQKELNIYLPPSYIQL